MATGFQIGAQANYRAAGNIPEGVPALSVKDLKVGYRSVGRMMNVVDGVSFDIARSEVLGIVGELGSGKSTLALAIPRLIHLSGGEIVDGSIRIDGREIVTASEQEMRNLRGAKVGLVFQQPLSSLNPVFLIGYQLIEALRRDPSCSHAAATEQAIELLRSVRLPDAASVMHRYPHELSGGMRQRVVIAIAKSRNPALLVLDEPTTALDVTIQAQILELLRGEQHRLGLSMLFISHDIGVIAAIADRVGVMYAGRMVELGPVRSVIDLPAHPYTWGLIRSVPKLGEFKRHDPIPGSMPSLDVTFKGCRFVDRCVFRTQQCFEQSPPMVTTGDGHAAACWYAGRFDTQSSLRLDDSPTERRGFEVRSAENLPDGRRGEEGLLIARDLTKLYRAGTLGGPLLRAVDGVDFEINRGEILGLVGESGCGKSTLARLTLRLIEATSGEVLFRGTALNTLSTEALRKMRPAFQMVFQNPAGALNPRLTVRQILRAPLRIQTKTSRVEEERKLREVLGMVGLSESYLDQHPHQLSGGQKQRVSIARALILQPQLIVCDEPVSALDVSTQAHVINLLRDLRDQLDLTYLFISHDLATVCGFCDRVAVMYLGKIVEIGPASQVLGEAAHPYTRALLEAVPSLDGKAVVATNSEMPSPFALPPGCRFHTRCPRATEICRAKEPQLRELAERQWAACHHPHIGNSQNMPH